MQQIPSMLLEIVALLDETISDAIFPQIIVNTYKY